MGNEHAAVIVNAFILSDFSIMFHTDKTRVVCNMVVTCQSGRMSGGFGFHRHDISVSKKRLVEDCRLALILPTCLSDMPVIARREPKECLNVSPKDVERGNLEAGASLSFQTICWKKSLNDSDEDKDDGKTKGANNFQIREGPRW
jgi:hypothetical protein